MDTRAERMEGLVLRTIPYGDSDVVVHLLVRGRGRVAAFARSARSSQRRFGGALEAFHLVDALIAGKPGQDLSQLREARVVEPHARLREDLHRIAHAGYASELAHDLTRDGEPADALLDLLLAFFGRLGGGAATSARLRAFELGALDAAGLAPELSACARCGAQVAPGRAAFDPDAGGLVCPRCARPSSLLLTHGSRAVLAQLQQKGLAGADAPLSADGTGRPADARAFEDAAAQAARPLTAFVAHHVGHALRALQFLAQVGAAP